MSDAMERYRGPVGRALATETLALMATHDIPVTAANYEIWLAHQTGTLPDLSREIGAQIARGESFNDDANAALHERFFASTRVSQQMVQTGESIARELADVVATLRDAGAQSGSYASALQSAAASIDGDAELSNVRAVIADLATATREMADKNRRLSAQMETSSRQVETLQSTLQNVKLEASTDSLTGLANRRLFDETLRLRLAEAETDKTGLCLIMCDIDHFKRFNDTWGHLVGDQVIRFIAAVIRHHTKDNMLAARYGGEEFAIVVPQSKLHEAMSLAASIRQTVKSKRLSRRSSGESLGSVTISIGVAEFQNGEPASSLIGRADACLYASKRHGRDRVTSDIELVQSSAA
ncbi:MAG: GGDEF domain-containing protein [Hyphomonadaceae bacterium]